MRMWDQSPHWKGTAVWIACLCLPAAPAAGSGRGLASEPAAQAPHPQAAIDDLLDSTFRIDIDAIEATLDWYPASGRVDASTTLTFRMRPGQTRAALNFTPLAAARASVTRLVVDGRPFNPQSNDDVRVANVPGTRQPFAEIQYPLDPSVSHTLIVDYRLTVPAVYPRFSSEVNDLLGRGNEAVWPTLNTPHELARHVLRFRVHDSRLFRFVGSGRVESARNGAVQEWLLDTQRAVSSYSVMFVLLPEADTEYREWLIDGVEVRALAYTGVNLTAARTTIETWLPELRRRFGPFPALHGLSLFLFSDTGGGMEYYGGTISSLSALRHEVLHSYFGCSVVARTYPDTWLDEAITSWYEETVRGVPHAVLPDDYRGNWVGARPPASVGFSVLAYTDGASIMQEIANRLGGTDGMAGFLASLVRDRSFAPFTTMDFIGDLDAYAGIDLRSKFLAWIYNGREPSVAAAEWAAEPGSAKKALDLDPGWIRGTKR